MREFDEYGLSLCKYQAALFEMSKEKTECSSPIFLRRFMNSDVAERMDKVGFLYESLPQESVIAEIEIEFGESAYGKLKYHTEELYWIGYLYRYWCYTHQISSKRLYKMIKPQELKKMYYPYHSLDPAQAIERIKEANGWREDDYIEKGVKLMREWKRRH